MFAPPGGGVWVVDALGATWRLDGDAAVLIDDHALEVRVVEGDTIWAVRERAGLTDTLVRSTDGGPFEDVSVPFETVGHLELFGAGSRDLWVLCELEGPDGPWNGMRGFPAAAWHFNGTVWTEQGSLRGPLHGAAVIDATHAWVVSESPMGPHPGSLMRWDGVEWSSDDDVPFAAAVDGQAGGAAYAIGQDVDLYGLSLLQWDGARWQRLAEATAPLGVSRDGIVWAVAPDGALARWTDGAFGPGLFRPDGASLVAGDSDVWLGAPSISYSETTGPVHVTSELACGTDVTGRAEALEVGGRAFATWTTRDPVHGTFTTSLAVQHAGTWQRVVLPVGASAGLVTDGSAAWALATLVDLRFDSALARFDGTRWVEVLDLPGLAWVGGGGTGAPGGSGTWQDGSGRLWLLASDPLQRGHTELWAGDADGFAQVATFPFDATHIGGADHELWVAGGAERWRQHDGVWTRFTEDRTTVTGMVARGTDDVWLVVDRHVLEHFDGQTWTSVCPDSIGQRDFVDIGASGGSVWLLGNQLVAWDGNTLREGIEVRDNDRQSRSIVGARLEGDHAWLSADDGLMRTGPLTAGAALPCAAPVPLEVRTDGVDFPTIDLGIDPGIGSPTGCGCGSAPFEPLLVGLALYAMARCPRRSPRGLR